MTMNNSDYIAAIRLLKTLDEKQLMELFVDINDIKVIERILDCANAYIIEYDYSKDEEPILYGKSDWDDWKSTDNARRSRELKAEK